MIETPRAALAGRRIGKQAEFFSFGTNDLTQMTLGFSRDDAGKFLPEYLTAGHAPSTTRSVRSTRGRGPLVRDGGEEGGKRAPASRSASAASTAATPTRSSFFHGAGLDYVSCSPFRVPIARLAAAQAAISA